MRSQTRFSTASHVLSQHKEEYDRWNVQLFVPEPFNPNVQPQYCKHKVRSKNLSLHVLVELVTKLVLNDDPFLSNTGNLFGGTYVCVLQCNLIVWVDLTYELIYLFIYIYFCFFNRYTVELKNSVLRSWEQHSIQKRRERKRKKVCICILRKYSYRPWTDYGILIASIYLFIFVVKWEKSFSTSILVEFSAHKIGYKLCYIDKKNFLSFFLSSFLLWNWS